MRRPHVGQSLRSFWAGWSHQLQKRSVLHGPRELGSRRRQRKQLADDLQLLARLAIPVRAAGLGLQDHLAAGRWRPQSISLPDHRGADLARGPAANAYPAARARSSSSTATCSAGPAPTSTTRRWPRPSPRAGHEVHLLCQDRDPLAPGLGRRGRGLGRRGAGGPRAPLARPRHGLPARHRRPAAALRRRSLRGHRGAPVPGAERRGARALPRAQRGGRARGRRAPCGRTWRSPTTS